MRPYSEMLTVREAAQMLRVHMTTVRKWCDRGFMAHSRLPHNRGDRRIPRSEVERLLGGSTEALLKVSEAAQMFHVHPNTVRKWCRKGYIQDLRMPGRHDRRIPRSEVKRLLTSQQISPVREV